MSKSVALVTGILGLAVGAMGAAGPSHALTPRGLGTVTGVRGDVVVSHVPAVAAAAGRPATEALRFRDDVFFRDVIDTQRESAAKLLLKGRAIFTVRELSRVELVEGVVPAQSGRTRSIVHLFAGAVRALVQKDLFPQNEMEIHTPNATAAIRGTELIAETFLPDAPLPPTAEELPAWPAAPAPEVVSRFYVRKGLIEVEGLFAGAGEGVEKVGNRPPRRFRFGPKVYDQMLPPFAVAPGPGLLGNRLPAGLVGGGDQAIWSPPPSGQPELGWGLPGGIVPPPGPLVLPPKPGSPNTAGPAGSPAAGTLTPGGQWSDASPAVGPSASPGNLRFGRPVGPLKYAPSGLTIK